MLVASRTQNSEKGMATIEAIAMLMIFVVLFAYTMGMFSAIHTGILNSIAARSYAFETFRHRTDLTYFRDTEGSGNDEYSKIGYRFHAVRSEDPSPNSDSPLFVATRRPIEIGLSGDELRGVASEDKTGNNHSVSKPLLFSGNEQDKTNPIWIKTVYGICLNAQCGG